MDSEQLREDVWRKISGLNNKELMQICTGLELKLSLTNTKRSTLYNAVVKHLMAKDEEGDEEDESQQQIKDAVFQLVDTTIDKLLSLRSVQIEAPVKTESVGGGGGGSSTVEAETGGVGGGSKTDDATTTTMKSIPTAATMGNRQNGGPRVEIHKLQEFKITGGTVACRGEGELDYISLSYQIQAGKEKGYRTREIMAAVVKAMKAGSSMKKFYELNPHISEEKFFKMIRSRYEVKDSATLLIELSNSAQEPTESESNYLFRLLCLKNMIIMISRDEGTPLDETMVNRRFFHALGVGLRKETVRLELQPTLNMMTADDEDLVDLVSKIVTRDAERRQKVKGGGKNASTNALEADLDLCCSTNNSPVFPNKSSKEDAILAEVRNLAVSMNELKTVKTDVENLGKKIENVERRLNAVENGAGAGGSGGSRGYKFPKCQACETTKSFCNHCSKCGSADHKKKDCLN